MVDLRSKRGVAGGAASLLANSPEMPAFDFVLAGRYRLIAPLGEGGMATVYRGRDLRLNRDVAIKILREDLTRDPDFLRRFEREAQTVASLSHPSIVPVYDVGEENGTHYIVMEYVRGRTLKDILEAGGPLSPQRAIGFMSSVLQALEYAHQRGLIHRDVKPQNILVTANDNAVLADFGIAHLADGSTTRTAAILGSAHYLSPEQARGDEATELSDVYACGVVLYEMIVGEPPFTGANALAIANQHIHGESPPPHSRVPSTPEALSDAVVRALAKRPDDRFAGAREFLEFLQSMAGTVDATSIMPLDVFRHRDEVGVEPEALDVAPIPGLLLHRSTRKTVGLALICAVVAAILADAAGKTLAGFALPAYPSAPYAVLPGALAIAFLIAWLRVRSWSYSMDGNAAVMQWGLLGHHRFGIPVRYITTLELKQSPIDRVFGVGTLELCARDELGHERRLVMEDLPHPRETYEELTRYVGQALRVRVPANT